MTKNEKLKILKSLYKEKDKIGFSFLHYEDDISDVSFFNNIEEFAISYNPNFVFIGLNPSRQSNGDFKDFHDNSPKSKDKNLSELVKRCKDKVDIENSLILDIFHKQIDSNSGNVDVNKNDEVDETIRFLEPLIENKSTKFFVFGWKAFKKLNRREELSGRVFRLVHYSQRTYTKSEMLSKQINEIEKQNAN